MINGCGGEGGFKFKTILDWIKYVKYFDYERAASLYQTIETKCCNPHDLRFDEGGNILDFLKANYEFSENLIKVLHWTNSISRMFIFILSFFGLNLLSIKLFNWK